MIRPTRRTWQIVVLLLFTLALTGCDVKEEIDAAISLKEMAFISLSPELVKKLVLPATCLIPLALIGGIMALVSDNWRKVGTIVGVMLGIGLLSYIIPSIETLGLRFWPEELSLTWIGGLMGWEFPIPKGDANPVTLIWALSFTVTWPLIHATWQFVLIVALIFTVIAAAIVWSWRPLAIAASAILGWILAPRALATVILVITSLKPEGAIASTLIMFNLIYIFSVGLTLLCSYFLPPFLIWHFLPDDEPWWKNRREQEDAAETEPQAGDERHPPHGDDDELPTLFLPEPPSDGEGGDGLDPDLSPDTDGSSPSEDMEEYHPDPDAKVIEGAFLPEKDDNDLVSSDDLPEDEAPQEEVLGESNHESDLLPDSEQPSDVEDEVPAVETTSEPTSAGEETPDAEENVSDSDDETDLLPVEITVVADLETNDVESDEFVSGEESPADKFKRLIEESERPS